MRPDMTLAKFWMVGVLLAVTGGPPVSAGEPPNILVILADDFGYECVRANGGVDYETPQIDALAASGARFQWAFATPLCTPTRVELLTGRYNCRNYVSFGEFDFREKTFATVLRTAGYRSTIIGKWQLEGGSDGPNRAGFDEYLVWQLTAEDKGSRYWDPKLMRDGKELPDTVGKYGPDICMDAACEFLERNKDRRFLAYLPMMLTHGPFEPPPADSGTRPAGKVKGNPRHFPAMVNHLDRNVGRILAKLDSLGLKEKTLVIFTGDNGTPRGLRSRIADGDEPARTIPGGKGQVSDNGWHVPLIVSWPGTIKPRQVRDELVDVTDILPTLADAAGVALKDRPAVDGHSFYPLLVDQAMKPRDWVYLHYEPRHGRQNNCQRVVREHRWKLCDDGKLYDLKADPDEQKPLLAADDSGESAAARSRLDQVLASFPAKAPKKR